MFFSASAESIKTLINKGKTDENKTTSYRAWDKYDDLTTFTDLENEDPEDIFTEID
ncbi:MAG: hypothetical protein K9L57_00325 [Spirochaetaceae bacterium]|nr:hypothetical protein [Spirochaetia bacterium]MCF7950056.1 hypothetical protein [Spirochaetaceae bacterium]